MPFVGFLLFGTLIGGVVRMLVAEKAGGWAASVMSGGAGALFGGLLGRADAFRGDPESAAFMLSLLGAFASVGVYHALTAFRREPV